MRKYSLPLQRYLVFAIRKTMSKKEHNLKKEVNRERFKRLGALRTNAVLKRLKVLGNCANKRAYEYYEDEIDKIFSEIEKKVKGTKAKFHFTKDKEFRL